jgi:hypothetical protein
MRSGVGRNEDAATVRRLLERACRVSGVEQVSVPDVERRAEVLHLPVGRDVGRPDSVVVDGDPPKSAALAGQV